MKGRVDRQENGGTPAAPPCEYLSEPSPLLVGRGRHGSLVKHLLGNFREKLSGILFFFK